MTKYVRQKIIKQFKYLTSQIWEVFQRQEYENRREETAKKKKKKKPEHFPVPQEMSLDMA